MTSVDIEYCVPCGHLDNAIRTQRELLESYGRALDAVRLRTGEGGVFEVSVEGDLVWDKAEDGYDLDAIVEAVDDRVGASA